MFEHGQLELYANTVRVGFYITPLANQIAESMEFDTKDSALKLLQENNWQMCGVVKNTHGLSVVKTFYFKREVIKWEYGYVYWLRITGITFESFRMENSQLVHNRHRVFSNMEEASAKLGVEGWDMCSSDINNLSNGNLSSVNGTPKYWFKRKV